MSDLRQTLEDIGRQVRARPDSLGRVHSRLRRRERNRRIAATGLNVVVVGIALVAIVATFVYLQPSMPVASPINQTNVERLAPAWRRVITGAGDSAAALDGNTLYVAARNGKVYALDARTGETQWTGTTAPGSPSAPVVADGTMLVHVSGRLYAFAVGCAANGAVCPEQWSFATGGPNEASPTVVDGVAYVVANPGGLKAIPVSCGVTCEPLWVAESNSGNHANKPAVEAGVVWDTSSHAVSAYPASCGTSAATCQPIVDSFRPNGADLSSGPAIFNSVLYVGASDGRLYAMSTSCAAGGSCAVLGSGLTGGSIAAAPLVTGGRVYVGSNDGLIYAFEVWCLTSSDQCQPSWVGDTGGAINEDPVAASGVVHVASTDGKLYVFAESCRTDGGECRPLLIKPIGPLPQSPSIWTDRALYAESADGTITAFTVDGVSLAKVR